MTKEVTHIIKDGWGVSQAIAWLCDITNRTLPGGAVEIAARRPAEKRSLSQNAKLWPMLEDVAGQQHLVIDGSLEWANAEDWKDVFTSALRKHQRMAKGIDGGLVMLGMRTSKMKKAEFSDLIELMYAYGAEHGIRWSDKSLERFHEYRPAP